ncbi:hypothetical protein OQA88_9831 [Cercophora sp. LCS_1]
MASPGVAASQANGVAASSRPDSPASVNSSTKRKRDASDDGNADTDANGHGKPTPVSNGTRPHRDEKPLIRDFFDVLESLDPVKPGILKRPLPGAFSDNEPTAKRPKSEEDGKPTSIADKVSQQAYNNLEDLFRDLDHAAKFHIKELEARPDISAAATDEAIAKVVSFKHQAFDLWRREQAYPSLPRVPPKSNVRESLPTGTANSVVLTITGLAPTPRPLFTSLQRAATHNVSPKPIPDDALPSGVTATRILPDVVAPADKNGRSLTLGELFPSPRNLPPLQPPKGPKPPTKDNVLTFYHPSLTDKCKYRAGTYYSTNLSTGQWLDYSNATPATHPKTKQRERAQSLAGVKPSSIELEMSEMEALFRGAFSSFAPSKDDSAAIVSSRQAGHVWWTRVGQRSYNRLIESEIPEDDDGVDPGVADVTDFDEERVQSVIDNWDDSLVDPSLDEIMGKTNDADKDTDELLAEISDSIDTLLSHQRIRNLALPTSQDRFSADPVNGDMLRNGSLSHQPSEEEMLAYQTLKAQLSLVISSLPPFAVARLNSDKLEELAISTKVEVRTDEYKGIMEEDEPARLARQAAQQAANASQRQQHRAPSVGSAGHYPTQSYGPFPPGGRPIANSQHFPQTPVRPQAPGMYPQRPPSAVPIPQPQHYPQRPPPPAQYRPPGPAHAYAPQLAKAQTPYGHSNMPQYAASPAQPRMAPGFNMSPGPAPSHRYPQGYQPGYQQTHQQVHPQHLQHPPQPQHPQHSPLPQHQHPQMHHQMAQHQPQHPPQGYPQFPNGQPMPRTMSPQVPQAHAYGQSPTPPQQHPQVARPPYGSPGMAPNAQQRAYAPQPNMMGGPGGRPGGLTGYATVMPEGQQRQVMEQARARADAEQRVSGHMNKVAQGEVVGLAGIGLGGTYDVNKLAAAKMQMGASPRVMHGGPSPVNGAGIAPPSHSPVPVPSPGMPHGIPSPAPGPHNIAGTPVGQGFKPPPPAQV